MALANHSTVFFSLEDYKSCIMDINLCLKADYPEHSKSKVLIHKAKCIKEMGDFTEMRKTLMDAQEASNGLAETVEEKYSKTINDLLLPEIEKITPAADTEVAPTLPCN